MADTVNISIPICSRCEFFLKNIEMLDDFSQIKFGKCIKSIATRDIHYQMVTGVEEPIPAVDRFNMAKWERQCGECGTSGKNFKPKTRI